jgi:excisionase family DNA binding protein
MSTEVMDGFEPMLTPDEVSVILRCRRRTVAKWLREGQLPSVKLPGRGRLVRQSDLLHLVQEGRVGPIQPRLPGC